MELTYIYQKERNKFGRQCLFSDKNELMFSEASNRELYKNYILKNPFSQGTQYIHQMGLTEINTERAEYISHGSTHNEGGWPKEINVDDLEQTIRYKRKIEKSEGYISQVNRLIKPMEHVINKNNAVNIYENYFQDETKDFSLNKPSSQTINVYRDINLFVRPVTCLSWSPDCGTKLAIAHSLTDSNKNIKDFSTESYIWEIENPNTPLIKLIPKSSIICLEYNQRDSNSLVSGLYSGQVAAWDTRSGKDPIIISEREVSHRDPVTSVLWVSSKSNSEIFSSSYDGAVIWWDIRKISEPLGYLLMDPVKTDEQNLSRSYGVTVLEYEATIPSIFMCGTQQGYVFFCNRKGKVPTEKINSKTLCHFGSIYSLTRNPSFLKNFLTVGDWTASIWSEECKDNPIFRTNNHPEMLTSGAWSCTKSSMFFITRMDGVLDCWDLLQQLDKPILSVKVCDEPILAIKPHINGLVAVGSQNGSTYMVKLSEIMQEFDKQEKSFLTALFERETRRVKLLESKHREVKLKLAANQNILEDTNENEELEICKQISEQYLNDVSKERQLRNPELNFPLQNIKEKTVISCCKGSSKDYD